MPIMHGPGIRNPQEMQERNIVEQDVQAYVAIGWQKGPLPKGKKVEDVVIPANAMPVMQPVTVEEAAALAEAKAQKEETRPAPKKKGK